MDMIRHSIGPRQRGFSLVEVMVGVVIALIAVLVIYQVFATSEQLKRNTTGASEAQQTGLISTFMLSLEIGNAGNAIATAAQDLATCPNTGNLATIMRPIPVAITAGASNDTPDSFVTNYSVSNSRVTPAPFLGNAPAGADYPVESVLGFNPGDMIVAISPAGQCVRSTITAVTPDAPPNPIGKVTIAHSGATPAGIGFDDSAVLFNMGPAAGAQRVLYDVAGGTLRSTNLFNVVPIPNPIASNIVNFKIQYGIDNNNDGRLDTWVPATGIWAPAALMGAALPLINSIKAVRIGIIVQSEQFDRDVGDFDWVLFDCEDPIKANCPARLTGTIAAATAPAGNWRYRIYETVVPLRNHLWNPAL